MWLAALELVYELSLTYNKITAGNWEWPGRAVYRCLTLLGIFKHECVPASYFFRILELQG